VICSREDYEWSRSVDEYALAERVGEVFFPEPYRLAPRQLAELDRCRQLPVRFPDARYHQIPLNDEPGPEIDEYREKQSRSLAPGRVGLSHGIGDGSGSRLLSVHT